MMGKTPQQKVSSPSNPNYKTRVRTGCLVCRGRKIKCDEQRPSCQKCVRLNKSCVYKIPSRWGPFQSPVDSNPSSVDCRDEISRETAPDNAPPQTETRAYAVDEQLVFLGNTFDSGVQENVTVSDGAGEVQQLPTPTGVDETPAGHWLNAMPNSRSDRFQQTSQLIYLSTAIDWLAASEEPTSSSFSYFVEVLDCPLLSPFDHLNWTRMKHHIARLGLQQTPVAKSLLAVQTLYRAQVDHLPMAHAMSIYHAAVVSFESMPETVDFDVFLIVTFLLCLCIIILPNEDGPYSDVFNEAFVARLEGWLLNDHHSPVSLRICAWLQLLNTTTKRPGSVGIFRKPVLDLLYKHVREVPSLSELDRGTHPEHSLLYDTVAAPIFTFYLKLQTMSNRVTDVTHYRRSRSLPTDQAEVCDLMASLKADLFHLWENRPGPLQLQPDQLREHFSVQISDPLIALCGICLTAYYAEIVVVGRILGDPPAPTLEAKQALKRIRDIVEGDWNVSLDGALNPGYVRPLFVYALESFQEDETRWATNHLRQINHPISRSNFLVSFVEAHGEAQRAQGRRVTMKYFCYQTFGVPLPYM